MSELSLTQLQNQVSTKANVSHTHTKAEITDLDSSNIANQLVIGGSATTFNWSGQSGQPTWLWGGNSPGNMYVYNPSNFNVNYANTAGNANTVGGYTASQLISSGGSQFRLTSGNVLQMYINGAWHYLYAGDMALVIG